MRSERRGVIGHREKDHRDSGVVAVETGIVSMFLVLLMFGIIDSSFFFKNWITASSAARAGARMGASQPRSATFGIDAANQVTNSITGLPAASRATTEMWVYDANVLTGLPTSTGLVPSGSNCSTTCMKYTWSAGTSKLAYASGTWANTSQNACNGNAARDTLGVYVKFSHTAPLGFFFKNAVMSESTVMFLEPIPTGSVCS